MNSRRLYFQIKPKLVRMPIMEDDSDEYKFAKCNIALLKQTIRALRESDESAAARKDWPLLGCSVEVRGEWKETELTPSPPVSARKRSLSTSSGSNVKRARRLSAPLSDPEESPEAGPSTPPPPPTSIDRPTSPSTPPAPARTASDLPPPPSSSELTMTVPPVAAASTTDTPTDGLLTATDVTRLAALPAQQLTERLRQGGHLRLEPNLVRVAAAETLDVQTAALWLEHTLTPKVGAER